MSDIKGLALSVRDGGCAWGGDKQAANGSGGVMMCVCGSVKKRKVPSGRSGGTLYGGGDDLLSHSLLQYHRRDGA